MYEHPQSGYKVSGVKTEKIIFGMFLSVKLIYTHI